MKKSLDLVTLRKLIPFLNKIPDEIYWNLDTSEFLVPNTLENKYRMELEGVLSEYVMTYKKDVFNTSIPLNKHLCSNIKGATLDKHNLKILNDYENNVRTNINPNISFVVYKKPLVLINPKDSPLASFYTNPKIPL